MEIEMGQRGEPAKDLHNGLYAAEMLGNECHDLERYDRVFRQNGDPRDIEVLRWRYLENVAAEGSKIFVAKDVVKTMEDAALYATMGVPMWIDGQRKLGAQSLDTLTDAGHRRQGLFPLLANENYRSATADGHTLVYGFPNGNSIHSFVKKLRWASLDPVPFLVKPLRSGYFLKRALPSGLQFLSRLDFGLGRSGDITNAFQIGEVGRLDSSYDEVWRSYRQAGNIKIAVDRTSDYMNWRLFSYPAGRNYKCARITRDNRLVGIVAWTVEEKHGGKIGYILDVIFEPGETGAGKALLAHAIADMRSKSADAVLAWCCNHSPNYSSYRSAGFFNLPERLRPIELHWGVRSLQDEVSEVAQHRTNWYISYLDSDTV